MKLLIMLGEVAMSDDATKPENLRCVAAAFMRAAFAVEHGQDGVIDALDRYGKQFVQIAVNTHSTSSEHLASYIPAAPLQLAEELGGLDKHVDSIIISRTQDGIVGDLNDE